MPCLRMVVTVITLLSLTAAGSGEVPVPNASFEEGDQTPTGWTLNRGEGGLITPGATGAPSGCGGG